VRAPVLSLSVTGIRGADTETRPTLAARRGAAGLSAVVGINLARRLAPRCGILDLVWVGAPLPFRLKSATFLFLSGSSFAAWRPMQDRRAWTTRYPCLCVRRRRSICPYSHSHASFLLRAPALLLVTRERTWGHCCPSWPTQRLGQGAGGIGYGLLLARWASGAVAGRSRCHVCEQGSPATPPLVACSVVYAASARDGRDHAERQGAVIARSGRRRGDRGDLGTQRACAIPFRRGVRAEGYPRFDRCFLAVQAVGAVMWGGLAEERWH